MTLMAVSGRCAQRMLPKSDFRGSLYLLMFVAAVLECALATGQKVDKPLPDAPKQTTAESKGFFARWADSYRQDWFPSASASSSSPSAPVPARRGVPSPLDSPPFPNSDWSYGGSPVIGEPDTNSYPLMTAINQAHEPDESVWMDRSHAEFQHLCAQQFTRGER